MLACHILQMCSGTWVDTELWQMCLIPGCISLSFSFLSGTYFTLTPHDIIPDYIRHHIITFGLRQHDMRSLSNFNLCLRWRSDYINYCSLSVNSDLSHAISISKYSARVKCNTQLQQASTGAFMDQPLFQVLLHALSHLSTGGNKIISTLQMRALWLREVTHFAQEHKAIKWRHSDYRVMLLYVILPPNWAPC